MGDNSHDRTIGDRVLAPETLMLGYGYDPSLSEGSVKPPVFLTSTFVFGSAEGFCQPSRPRRIWWPGG